MALIIATILVFIIINFLIIFKAKTRTTIVISLISSHLIIALLLTITIINHNAFREIILALIIYSMVILFLISNYNPIYLGNSHNKKHSLRNIPLQLPIAILITIIAFFGLFFVTKNINPLSKSINKAIIAKEEKSKKNPALSKNYPSHKLVQERYFDKIAKSKILINNNNTTKIDPIKMRVLKEKLQDNFLLKRSSDIILIICAITAILLVFSASFKEEK